MDAMITTIRLSAGLRTIAGAKTVEVRTGPAATVGDLLQALWGVNAALASRILTAEGELAAGIMMIVRGKHIDFQQGLATPIGAGDEVMLIPPLSGG